MPVETNLDLKSLLFPTLSFVSIAIRLPSKLKPDANSITRSI
jgi:hypothetical protein